MLRTKFFPPQYKSRIFPRKRLARSLRQAFEYPLTLLFAGPGYGKSVLMADFCKTGDFPYAWLSLTKAEGELYPFLLHFIHAIKERGWLKQDQSLLYLEGLQRDTKNTPLVFHALINGLLEGVKEPTLFFLDDFHLVADHHGILDFVTSFITHMPSLMHVVISSRSLPPFLNLLSWRVQNGVLEITEGDLALGIGETKEYLEVLYQKDLTNEELSLVHSHTKGWISAVDLIARHLKQDTSITEVLRQESVPLLLLFAYMAREVLVQLQEDLQEFLVTTAALEVLVTGDCDFLLPHRVSEEILSHLVEEGLFTYRLGPKQYAYHPLFQQFLQEQAKERGLWQRINEDLGRHFALQGKYVEALLHWSRVSNYSAMLALFSKQELLGFSWELKQIEPYLKQIPEELGETYPRLYLLKGELARYRNRFVQAEGYYEEARRRYAQMEDARNEFLALQKLAMVYVDTVQPLKADEFLRRALALKEEVGLAGEETLRTLMAENLANKGQGPHFLECTREDVSAVHLQCRVLLRTGRLREAEEILNSVVGRQREKEGEYVKAHRECHLILSLLHSFKGNAVKAEELALEGKKEARRTNSVYTEAIAYMRLAHALQLTRPLRERAIQTYNQALALIANMEVERVKAEAFFGLSLVYGYLGDAEKALYYGEQSEWIARRSGDEWFSHQGVLAMGILAFHQKEGSRCYALLQRALHAFLQCHDVFGVAVCRLWLAHLLYREGSKEYVGEFSQFVSLSKTHGFGFLLNAETLCGVRQRGCLGPLIHRYLETEQAEEDYILQHYPLGRRDYHPGYSLRIISFGPLQVFRGEERVCEGEWKRESAKELLKLLLVFFPRDLTKEQICAYLWPELDTETAGNHFKVALHALHKVVEPGRKPRQEPFFVLKKGVGYGLSDRVEGDLDLYEKRRSKALLTQDPLVKTHFLETLSALYLGHFLEGDTYHSFGLEERERLRYGYLSAMEALGALYLADKKEQEAIAQAEEILKLDSLWEGAYTLMIRAYLALYAPSKAKSVYGRCKRIFERELGVLPSRETRDLVERE